MLRDSTDSLPQRLMVTLLGDYRHIFDSAVPAAALISVFQDFDITPESTRTALSRLVKKGILERVRTEAAACYTLTESAVTTIDEDTARILTFGDHWEWDGHWTLVAFSVAEAERHRRHALRTQLRGLGFAPLYDGLWAAASASVASARTALDHAGVANGLVIRGDIAGDPATVLRQFEQSWHLDDLARQYQELVRATEPLLDRIRGGQVAPAEALVARTRLMDAWRVFPRQDPDLPRRLLPTTWPRSRAHACFIEAWTTLGPPAEERLRQLLDRDRD